MNAPRITRRNSPPAPVDHGVIVPDHLYTFQAFEALTGIGRAGLREARKQGLRVRYLGRKGYVLGADVIDHVMNVGKSER